MSEKYQYNKGYAQKYLKETYDEIKVRVSRGQKEIIRAFAESHGESVNAYINRLIAEDMKRAGD